MQFPNLWGPFPECWLTMMADTVPGPADMTPLAVTTVGSIGTSQLYARGDHVHPDSAATTANTSNIATLQATQSTILVNIAALQSQVVQAVTKLTDGSGQVSWTFPTPFSANPVISADVLATANQPYSVRQLSLSPTAVSLQILGAAVVSVVGVNVLAAFVNSGAGLPVHITAVKAS